MNSRQRLLVFLVLAVACLLVYGQSVRFDFVNHDDNAYVTENQWVRSGVTGAGLRWAFGTTDYFYWQPLTWISHMIDCQLFGLRAGWHHLVSLLFHIVNTLLLFLVLVRLTDAFWRSAIAAAIFALHPLRIESVVWIAERKDVFSAFFFLAAIWCYLGYVERPSRGKYYLVMTAFLFGLMSKPMVMTLPFVLLLIDWWPLRRRAYAEKGPMFLLAALSGFVTSMGTGINWGSAVTPWQRTANALVSYTRYLELSFWPHNLAILYPFRTGVPIYQVVLAILLLSAITGVALWQFQRHPYLIVGWLWFVVGLLPASGIVQVGAQGMADRFTYLPQIGLIVAVVWGAADLLGRQRTVPAVLSGAVIAAFAVASWLHTQVWRDSVALFGNTVAVTRNNPGAQHFLAAALDDRKRFDEAFSHHAEAVRLQPDYFIAQYSYGVALERRGRTEDAIEHFRQALKYFPDYPEARRHLDLNSKRLELSNR